MGEEAREFIGREGKMRSSIQGDQLGSVEIIIQSDVLRLNVKSLNGEPLNYGDDVLIINEDAGKKFYIVQKDINLNNI